jgi:hypothetical protein
MLLGLVLVVLGVAVAAGAWWALGEVQAACSTDQARLGTFLGNPDAAKCSAYSGYAQLGLLVGVGATVLGLVLAFLPRRARA